GVEVPEVTGEKRGDRTGRWDSHVLPWCDRYGVRAPRGRDTACPGVLRLARREPPSDPGWLVEILAGKGRTRQPTSALDVQRPGAAREEEARPGRLAPVPGHGRRHGEASATAGRTQQQMRPRRGSPWSYCGYALSR